MAYLRVADAPWHPLWDSDWNDRAQSWTVNFVSGLPTPTDPALPTPLYAPCEVVLYDGHFTGQSWRVNSDQAPTGIYSSYDGAGLIGTIAFRGAKCGDTTLELFDVDPSVEPTAVPYTIKFADGRDRDLPGFNNGTQFWKVHFRIDAAPAPSQVPDVVNMMYTQGEEVLSHMFYTPVADIDYVVTGQESRVPHGRIAQ